MKNVYLSIITICGVIFTYIVNLIRRDQSRAERLQRLEIIKEQRLEALRKIKEFHQSEKTPIDFLKERGYIRDAKKK